MEREPSEREILNRLAANDSSAFEVVKIPRQPTGAIVVVAGALIMGLAKDDIPNEALPTIASIGLIAVGLFLVFKGGGGAPGNKHE